MIIGEPPSSSDSPLLPRGIHFHGRHLGLSGLMPRRPSRAGEVAIGRESAANHVALLLF